MKYYIVFCLLSFSVFAEMPDPLTFKDGSKVENLSDWKKRRHEILEILRSECFGRNPINRPEDLSFKVVQKDEF